MLLWEEIRAIKGRCICDGLETEGERLCEEEEEAKKKRSHHFFFGVRLRGEFVGLFRVQTR